MPAANTLQFPFDHVVIVVLENHGYSEIIGSAAAPYINNTLVKNGVLINNAFGEQHPSQPNYLWLFSGSNQGVNYDQAYWPPNAPGPVFNAPNLYTALQSTVGAQVPNFFGGYVDSGTSAPVTNYYQDTDNYANRHVPWLAFTNINNGNPASITKDFGSQFPSYPDYSTLPLVSFVIPGLDNDMHDYDSNGNGVTNPATSAIAISNGDTWLKTHLDGYAQWAKENNSLLIITFDEDSTSDWLTPFEWGGGGNGSQPNPHGMTAPSLGFNAGANNNNWPADDNLASGPNQIAMIFYGANLNCSGPFTVAGAGVNNINLLRTIESFYHLPKSGSQTTLAMAAGLTDGPITGFFTF
jgi:hypothetical protein